MPKFLPAVGRQKLPKTTKKSNSADVSRIEKSATRVNELVDADLLPKFENDKADRTKDTAVCCFAVFWVKYSKEFQTRRCLRFVKVCMPIARVCLQTLA